MSSRPMKTAKMVTKWQYLCKTECVALLRGGGLQLLECIWWFHSSYKLGNSTVRCEDYREDMKD